MAYSMDPIQDGCYPGTAVLVNKFDIREEAKLNEVEAVLVSARSAEWTNQPRADSFDFAHYKAVHCFLFSDLYDWAGRWPTHSLLPYDSFSHCRKSSSEMLPVSHFFFCSLACSLHA